MNDYEGAESDLTFSRVMSVHARGLTASDDKLLDLARKRALDPSVFEEFPPFFFGGEISSDRWDAYDTRMGASTLRNFERDANAGVAYLRGHVNREDPTGQTLKAKYFAAGNGSEFARVDADFFITPTPEHLGHVAKIRSGVVRDLSVGFYGGQWMCSICGKDMQAWFSRDGCMHLLGFEYANEKTGETQVAQATIEGGHLAEVSGVYDGATPGAMIAKARAIAAEGLIDDVQRDLIQVRYRILLPGHAAARHLPGATLSPTPGSASDEVEAGRETPMPPENEETRQTPAVAPTPTPPDAPLERLLTARSALHEGETPEAALTRILDEQERLRSLADDGRTYRTDLINQALAEGVRAQGNDFAQETYRAVLEGSTLEVIKRMKSDWEAIAARTFQGGRQTNDTEEQPAAPQPSRGVPDRAFVG